MVTYDSVTSQCKGLQAVGIATRHKVEGKLGTCVGASDKIKLDIPMWRGSICLNGDSIRWLNREVQYMYFHVLINTRVYAKMACFGLWWAPVCHP